MKLNLPLLSMFFIMLSASLLNAQTKTPYLESSGTISISDFKQILEEINARKLRAEPFKDNPLQDKEDYRLFLEILNEQKVVRYENDIRKWLKANTLLDDKDVGIVFISHKINFSQLYADKTGDKNKKKTAADLLRELCKKLKNNNLVKKSLGEKSDAIGEKLRDSIVKADEVLYQKTLMEYNQVSKTLKNINELILVLQNDFDKAIKEFEGYSDQIIESPDKTDYMVLARENQEWTDYLLNKKEILVVVLGGAEDLQNMKIKIDNETGSFEQAWNDSKKIIAAQLPELAGLMSFDAAQDCDNFEVKKNQQIAFKFFLTRPGKIKSPSTIALSEEKSKFDQKLKNHERAFLGLKVGVSAAYIDRKQFYLDANRELTVKADTSQQKEWKSNLMFMLDIYPFGRDVDRMEAIWKRNKAIGLFDLNRVGLTVGAKLSKDPLERMFLGLSYAITKELSINGGLAYNATPKDVSGHQVGLDATLDYLKENAERELKSSYYFGISLSPSAIGKTLGIIK